LIIDGASLIFAMDETNKEASTGVTIKDKLLELTKRCQAVVACRVSPDQKRGLVKMVKDGCEDVRTLAIGDGANDVAMIQEAHVGVGIKGEEGIQAVNAADYALAQFRFLSQLTLKHGRYNYIRLSAVICYMFYKNILMSIAQFWFNFRNGFSGQKYYTEGAIQMFNLLYSSIPIILLGVYDIDVSASVVFKFPHMYQAGVKHEYFNVSRILNH
jgi:magnesium-transporting ATPase (P-type)